MTHRPRRRAAAALVVLAAIPFLANLAGCATQGASFAPANEVPPGKALIYVYRPYAFGGAVYTPTVTLGHDISIALKLGGYYAYVAPPGPILLRITEIGTRSTTLDVKAGETYYYRGGLVIMGAGFPSFGRVEATEALPELKECKLIAQTKPAGTDKWTEGPVSASAPASAPAP